MQRFIQTPVSYYLKYRAQLFLPILFLFALGMQGSELLGVSTDTLPKINSIRLEANFRIDEESLLESSGLSSGQVFDPDLIQIAIDQFQIKLGKAGHYYLRIPFPEVIPQDENSFDLLFRIEELIDPQLVSIRFSGLRYFTENKLRELLLFPKDKSLNLKELPNLMDNILELYLERGYLFASVELDSLVLDSGLHALIRIQEGKPFVIEEYRFEGNQTTRENTLISLSGLSLLKTITPAALERAEQNILSKSYIRQCEVYPYDDRSLMIKIEEGNMTFLEGVLGYRESSSGKKEINGHVNLRFTNLWGTDRAIQLLWKELPSGSGEIELSYHESGSIKFPLAGDFNFYRANQDSTWIKMRSSADIYLYYQTLRYGIELSMENIQPGRVSSEITKSSSRSIGAFLNYSRTDHYYNPSKGNQAELRYRQIFSSGEQVTKTKNALEFDNTHYFRINQRITLALGTHLKNLDDPNALDYEKFRMGGYNSLRGYFEGEFSSRRLGWLNSEFRYRLSPESRIYLFYDQGAYEINANKLKSDNYGIGFGIRIGTKIGILGLEYGLGYRDNRFMDIGLGMIHAGLDTSF